MKEKYIFKNKYYAFDKSSIRIKIELLNNDDDFDEDNDEEDYYKGYREDFDDLYYEDYDHYLN